MAAITSRHGKLCVDFRYKGIRCRETTGLADNQQHRRRLQTVVDRMEAEITLGSFDYAKYFPNSPRAAQFVEAAEPAPALSKKPSATCPTFRDFAETWFAERRIEWRRSYADTVRISLDLHLLPVFADKALSEIAKADILSFRSGLARRPGQGDRTLLSPSRVNHIMTPLRMILSEAASRFDFISPWKDIKPLKEPRTEVDPFTLEEVQRILNAVRPDFRAYYTVRFLTGMRTGEIDGLRWPNVDFARRQILVREAVVRGERVPTKTDGSQRAIQMNDIVYTALIEQRKTTGSLGDYVFCARNGAPLHHRNITNRVWYPLLRLLDMPPRRPYQTRHTAATLWLASGENPEWIARQLGHTTTEMLFRVYSRFVPNLTRRDGSAFDRFLVSGGLLPASKETDPCR